MSERSFLPSLSRSLLRRAKEGEREKGRADVQESGSLSVVALCDTMCLYMQDFLTSPVEITRKEQTLCFSLIL